ncbi:MAG TPA: amidohydrolase family protein [Flavitalea sp.]|nr:amidohydrolase family protein [Flavitalea sp.]
MRLVICLLLLFTSLVSAARQSIKNKSGYVIRSVHVITMKDEKIKRNQDVVITNGVIIAIGATGKIKHDKNFQVIDGRGKYLMPGLAEMHAHVPPVDNLQPMKEVVMLFALKGITTIRGMLGHPRHLELRKKLESGEIIGPRLVTSGPSFNGNSVPEPSVGVAMVKNQKNAGYDFLKIHPGLSTASFDSIAATAKAVHIPFAGHVPFAVGIWHALTSGYTTIDHMDGFVEGLVPGIETMSEQETGLFGLYISQMADTTKIPALLKGLRENQVWVVPTQSLAERWFAPDKDAESLSRMPEMKYMSQATLSNWVQTKENMMRNARYKAGDVNHLIQLRRKLIYACNNYGVGLLLGSDAPQVFNVPGFSAHHELQYLVDAGLTPYEALRTATSNVGVFLKREDLGTIAIGSVSDLLLLEGNPLEDISQTRNIAGVMLGKKWMSKEFIVTELKKLEKN